MVTRIRIILICEQCGTDEGVETHTLGLDDQAVEVELCKRHYTELKMRVEPLLQAGRSLNRKRRKPRSKAA